MQLTLASQDDFLLATAVGQVSIEEVRRVLRTAVDTATEWGIAKILLDLLAVKGELSDLELYEVGRAMAGYCVSKSIYPKLAVVGNPPTVNGFGAEVASNRGLTSRTFSDRQLALNWLRAVDSRAHGS